MEVIFGRAYLHVGNYYNGFILEDWRWLLYAHLDGSMDSFFKPQQTSSQSGTRVGYLQGFELIHIDVRN